MLHLFVLKDNCRLQNLSQSKEFGIKFNHVGTLQWPERLCPSGEKGKHDAQDGEVGGFANK